MGGCERQILRELIETLLQGHDWNYEYSDNRLVWSTGNGQRHLCRLLLETFMEKGGSYEEFLPVVAKKVPVKGQTIGYFPLSVKDEILKLIEQGAL